MGGGGLIGLLGGSAAGLEGRIESMVHSICLLIFTFRFTLEKVIVMISHIDNLLDLYSCGRILISQGCYAITPVCAALSPVFCSWSGVHSDIVNVALGKVAFQVGLMLT